MTCMTSPAGALVRADKQHLMAAYDRAATRSNTAWRLYCEAEENMALVVLPLIVQAVRREHPDADALELQEDQDDNRLYPVAVHLSDGTTVDTDCSDPTDGWAGRLHTDYSRVWLGRMHRMRNTSTGVVSYVLAVGGFRSECC
ncbi:hypothetical protein [Streptomyces luteireticuli]|uniref:hypothetical protein n=1 Tax=Streptomyces luteireticuli TaxID=173858 RepID=UPI003557C6BD